MKKNITINLFGTLYAIDEDAYNLLNNYLENMKRYFSQQQGGEEIADDIEHRVAELLWQKKNEENMEAVNIDVVKEIIGKIGNAADIDGKDGDGGTAADGSGEPHDEVREEPYSPSLGDRIVNGMRNKRLYRDPKNKVLAGILGGLSTYFGAGDPVIWRLGYVLLVFLFSMINEHVGFISASWLIIAYVVLIFIIPEANTPEDRLRMTGKDVSQQNLNEQIIADSAEQERRNSAYDRSERAPQPATYSNGNSGCLWTGLKIAGVLVLIALCFPLLITFVALIFAAIGFFGVFAHLPQLLGHVFDMPGETWVNTYVDDYSYLWIIGLLATFLVIGLAGFGIYKMLISSDKLKGSTAIVLIISWVFCLAVMIFSFSTAIGELNFMKDNFHIQYHINTSVTPDTLGIDTMHVDTVGYDAGNVK